MGKTTLIRANTPLARRLKLKAELSGRSIPELLEFAEFPFIPPKKFKKE